MHLAQPGHLYVVATPLGCKSDIGARAAQILASCTAIACEDTRVTRRLLGLLEPAPDAAAHGHRPLVSYREENERQQTPRLLEQLQAGASVALVSDAGTPTISDPGFRLVRACRNAGIPVCAIPGPCAAVAALSISGLPTHPFCFLGFLPHKASAKQKLLAQYQHLPATLVMYESCHRIGTLPSTLAACGPQRVVALAREMTKHFESFWVGTLAELPSFLATHPHKGEWVALVAPPDYTL
jgi:16S rRNA (cytidine1402-2'-O)-methyltransferase